MSYTPTTRKPGINAQIAEAARAYYQAYASEDAESAIEALLNASAGIPIDPRIDPSTLAYDAAVDAYTEAILDAADAYRATRRKAIENGAAREDAAEAAEHAAIDAYHARIDAYEDGKAKDAAGAA